MLEEKNSNVKKLTGLEQLVEISKYLMLILFIVFLCLAILGLVVLPCWLINECC
jgi:hypothetical protein